MAGDNPNNCATCDHKRHPDGGHCYMFRWTPTEPCAHHTFRVEALRAMRLRFGLRIAAAITESVDAARATQGERNAD